MLISFGLLLAYVFGLPLISNFFQITPALNTSFVLLLTGLGLLTLNYRNYLRLSESQSESQSDIMLSKLPTYIVIFVIFSVGIITLAYDYYRNVELNFRHQAELKLLAVSRLKTEQLVLWRKERLGNALLSRNLLITASIKRLLANPDHTQSFAELQSWLKQYIQYFIEFGYTNAFFLDSKGVTQISEPEGINDLDPLVKESALTAMQTGQISIHDFYRTLDGKQIFLALIIPLVDKEANTQHHCRNTAGAQRGQ